MRVLSLLPAATEIVAALDLADSLVGITHECDWPPSVRGVARVTASAVDAHASSAEIDGAVRDIIDRGEPLFALDENRIAALEPDVILTQELCDVCAVSETDVRAIAGRLATLPRVVTLAGSTLDGILADIAAVAEALDAPARGTSLLASLRARMRAVHETLKAARAPRPRVAVIEWSDPLYVAGHWVPEMIRRAGGIDAVASPGEHSRRLTPAELRAAAPELLIVAPCGFDVDRAEREARALLSSDAWAWAAMLPAWVVDGNAFTSRPGPRVVDGIELFARACNPSLFSPADPARARPVRR